MPKVHKIKAKPRPLAKTLQQRGQPSRARRAWQISKLFGGFVVSALAWVGGYALVDPRISVEPPTEQVDPYDYYSPPFVLKNDDWLLPIYDVEVLCKPKLSGAFSEAESFKIKFDFMVKGLSDDKISSGEERDIVCTDILTRIKTTGNVWVTKFGVQMDVTFRPIRFVPWRSRRLFDFALDINGPDRLRWMRPQMEEEKKASGSKTQ